MTPAEWAALSIGGLTLLGSVVWGVSVISRRAGELVVEVRGAKQELHDLGEWVKSVESKVDAVVPAVARLEGKIDSYRADSDRNIKAVKADVRR